jgi:CBS domain containing-hemolysin-like protein
VDVDALDAESGPEEVLAFVRDKKHSRIPVYRGSIDNVVGILRASAYMRAYLRDKETPDLLALLDAPCFVHQSASVDEVLEEMTRRKVSIAVVTDNYGGTAGIVTVEDILEELVGEIWDEDDVAVDDFRTLDDGSCLADADLDMEEVLERLGYEDPEDTEWEHKPLGEWVYEHFDVIPAKGDSFDWQGLRVQVEEIDHRRIRTLRITRLPGAETGGEPA